VIETERLLIRAWRDADIEPFHAMGQDAEVMRFIGDTPTPHETRAQVERQRRLERERGYCFWAVEQWADGAFIGFCGLKPGPAGTPIEDALEIGWRIARPHWRRGFAFEAARACLDRAWANPSVDAVAAITVPANEPSRGLMEKLGLRRVMDGDFDHPDLPEGHPLRRHVHYRIARPHP